MGSHERASDAALLHATRTDPAAFDALYVRYERPLLAYFGARTRDPELTADLTAEVFAAVLEPLALDDDACARIEAVASIEVDLDRLLATLPTKQRTAIVARVVDQREYGEIAAELRCSELVVRKRVSRALTALRSRLPSRPKETLT